MSFKKIITITLLGLLCISILGGCGNGNNDASVISGDTNKNEVILEFGEEKVTAEEFQYYVYVAAMETAYSIDPNVAQDIAGFDWNQKDKDGKLLTDSILDQAINSALVDSIIVEKAREQGVFLSDEEKKANIQAVESARVQNGDEVFLLNANSMGISGIEGYKNLANRMMAVDNAKKEISENIGKYSSSELDLSSWKSEDTVTAQHVLIKSDSEKYTNPEETAREVLEKAKNGEDFAKLIEEYNEDPGATAAGYTFGPGEMVIEFEKAAFALECGEISDIVKTDYGYHVIHRITGLSELQNYWLQNEKYTKNSDVIGKISVEDIMNTAGKAQKKLLELNATKK